jgi:membrane protein implicated in regulation of membrane protease activity
MRMRTMSGLAAVALIATGMSTVMVAPGARLQPLRGDAMAATAMQYTILGVAVVALIVLIIVASRRLQKRVRSGSPVHREFKDEWLGDDTDHRDDD